MLKEVDYNLGILAEHSLEEDENNDLLDHDDQTMMDEAPEPLEDDAHYPVYDSFDPNDNLSTSSRSSDPAMMPVWYLSWSTLIQAAKDIKQLKESRNKPKDPEELTAQMNAVHWVLNPMMGSLSLAMCHEVLFSEQNISYRDLGLRILNDPTPFAKIDMQKIVRQIKSQRFDTRAKKTGRE